MSLSVEVLGPQHVGRYAYSEHEVVEIMLERHSADYAPGQHDDGRVVAFASEGGGFSAVVAGGGLAVLEQTELVRTFDHARGTSGGTFNAASTAAGQAVQDLTNYLDLTKTPFVRPERLAVGRAPANFDYPLRDIMLGKRPYSPEALARGPKLGFVAVNLATQQAELLQDFEDIPDLYLGIRASSSMPILAGPPTEYKGQPMSDGGLLDAVAFRAALEHDATHVLALRSCGEDTRKAPDSNKQIQFIQHHPWGGAVLAELTRDRARIYNEDAENLQAGDVYPNVFQVALEGDTRPVGRITKSIPEIKNGIQLGADAMGKTLGTPILHVAWIEDRAVILTNPSVGY